MFCQNCGKEVKDTAKFCPACGSVITHFEEVEDAASPAETADPEKEYERTGYNENNNTYDGEKKPEEETGRPLDDGLDEYYGTAKAKSPKKKGKKGFIIAIVVIAACVAAAIVCAAVFIFGKTNIDKIQDAASKTETALLGRTSITKYLDGFLKADEMGASVKVDDIGDIVSAISPDAAAYAGLISGNMELSAAIDRKGNASGTFDLSIMGITAAAGYYSDSTGNSDIVVDIPALLEKPYGLALDTLQEDLANSVLSPSSGSSISLSDYMYSSIENALGTVQEITDCMSVDSLNELVTELEDSKETQLNFTVEKSSVNAGDGSISVDAYKAAITTKMLEDIIQFAGDWLEKQIDLSAQGISISDMVDAAIEELDSTDFEFNIEIDIANGYIVRAVVAVASDSDSVFNVELLLGSDPSTTDHVTLTLSAVETLTIDLDLTNASEDEIGLTIITPDENEIALTASYDKSASSFRAALTVPGQSEEIIAAGNMTITDEALSISDIVLSEGDYDIELTGLSAELTTDPTIKKLADDYPDGYTNVLSLSESDIQSIIEMVQNSLSSIMYLMG